MLFSYIPYCSWNSQKVNNTVKPYIVSMDWISSKQNMKFHHRLSQNSIFAAQSLPFIAGKVPKAVTTGWFFVLFVDLPSLQSNLFHMVFLISVHKPINKNTGTWQLRLNPFWRLRPWGGIFNHQKMGFKWLILLNPIRRF